MLATCVTRAPMLIATWDGGMAGSRAPAVAWPMVIAIINTCPMPDLAIAPTVTARMAIARMATAGIGTATNGSLAQA